jgi:putative flippase GtrA
VPAAASLGYLMGLVLAFPFMRASVFRFGGRGLERMPLYLASGAVGILVTYLTTLAMSESLGQGFHLSKIVASGLSFITVFFFRYFWVFRVRP